ncbi:uncharacterized protein LOC127263371 [Andrographis paniculata]|uniref:uncharacterized protein LOC127263371 n=1 Tax=Andrographis paniculata TaxID=175694 RepID=UPI0021E82223|nr:uncharacterized protein LOC127263371 [Andrographis paniculata]
MRIRGERNRRRFAAETLSPNPPADSAQSPQDKGISRMRIRGRNRPHFAAETLPPNPPADVEQSPEDKGISRMKIRGRNRPHFAAETLPSNPPADAAQSPKNKGMETFQGIVMELAQTRPNRKLTGAETDLVRNRLREFASQYKNPDHPPYSAMIETALAELNDENGSTVDEISQFVQNRYSNLPLAHEEFLQHHLRQLRGSGYVVATRGKRYMLSAVEEPAPEATPAAEIKATRSKCLCKKCEIKRRRHRQKRNQPSEIDGEDTDQKPVSNDEETLSTERLVQNQPDQAENCTSVEIPCSNAADEETWSDETSSSSRETSPETCEPLSSERPSGVELTGLQKLTATLKLVQLATAYGSCKSCKTCKRCRLLCKMRHQRCEHLRVPKVTKIPREPANMEIRQLVPQSAPKHLPVHGPENGEEEGAPVDLPKEGRELRPRKRRMEPDEADPEYMPGRGRGKRRKRGNHQVIRRRR